MPPNNVVPDWTRNFGATAVPNALFLLNAYDEGDHPRLTPPEYVVLLLLFVSVRNDASLRRLSTRELARRANISQRQVFRVLNSLVAKRYLRFFGDNYIDTSQLLKRFHDVSYWALDNKLWVAPSR